MKRIQEDIVKIEKEIDEVKNRDDIEIETFQKIVRRRKKVWNAYFLDCLKKEKNTFEYINQIVDEQVATGFKKVFRKMGWMQEEIDRLEKERKDYITPMSFEKLVEWTKEEDVLSDLFIMPVRISDIKRLLNDAVHAEGGK